MIRRKASPKTTKGSKLVLTPMQFIKKLEEAENSADKCLKLSDTKVEGELILSDREISTSLDLVDCEFSGYINLCRSKFTGAYIDLDRSRILGGLYMNGLESVQPFSIYLRESIIGKELCMSGVKRIHWLCVGGLRFFHGSNRGINISGAEISKISIDTEDEL